jgi:hypothetical protein
MFVEIVIVPFPMLGLAGRSVFFTFFIRLAVQLFVLFLRLYLLVVAGFLRKLY